MTAPVTEPTGARARQTYYWRVRNARTRQPPASAGQTWHIQPGHPGGAYCDLGHELNPPAHHTPTLLSRSRPTGRGDEQEFRGGCLACDWGGPRPPRRRLRRQRGSGGCPRPCVPRLADTAADHHGRGPLEDPTEPRPLGSADLSLPGWLGGPGRPHSGLESLPPRSPRSATPRPPALRTPNRQTTERPGREPGRSDSPLPMTTARRIRAPPCPLKGGLITPPSAERGNLRPAERRNRRRTTPDSK